MIGQAPKAKAEIQAPSQSQRTIQKRDGTMVAFDASKITECISKACAAVGENKEQIIGANEQNTQKPHIPAQIITSLVMHSLGTSNKPLTVEYVQDVVEDALIGVGLARVAKAYILYRENRTRIREGRSELMDAVAEIVQETSRENANIGNSPSAKVLQISESASKSYYLKRVLPDEFSKAHLEGDIYIHDLAWYGKTLTCLQIPLAQMLEAGFSTGHGYVRPPKGIRSATALAAIILQSNQNDMHGGQSYAWFDRDLGVYAEMERKKKLDEVIEVLGILEHCGKWGIDGDLDDAKSKAMLEAAGEYAEMLAYNEVDQAMEAFIYNMNTMHSRAGTQVPFSSVNFGTDTSWGGRAVTECLLRNYEKGLGKGEVPIFPNLCFKVKRGVNSESCDPNYDLFKLAMEVACTRLFPAFSFQDASFNSIYASEEIAYMGCRTRVVANVNGSAVVDGRGNLSFTSINMPRLGICADGDSKKFWELLDNALDITCRQLLHRYDIQKNLRVRDFPFLMEQGLYMDSDELTPDCTIDSAIKHGTLAIGFIGLAECIKAMTGKHHGECPSSQKLGIEIVTHMRNYCDTASKTHGLNITLLATPAEQLSGKFLKADRDKYGILLGITDKPWYTNSFHVPVEFPITMFEKIAHEGVYHKLCNAGHISYVELESAPEHNVEAFEEIIRAMADADMGYASVNFPVDICRSCGMDKLLSTDTCPACGSSDICRVRRITGYLSTLDRFNDSKLAEEKNRVKHGM